MLKKFIDWLIAFLELQFIISIISLPILIHWGLAVSFMLPIANLIFTPLLSLFLWVSCLFALCNIMQLPCSFIVTILDGLAHCWHYLLSFATPQWLIGFDTFMIWPAITIAIFLFFLYSFFYPTKYKSLLILGSCCIMIFFIRWIRNVNGIYPLKNLKMIALKINKKNYLIDHGSLCAKRNFYSFIDYTILPELVKIGAITTIDTLILYKPNKKLAQIAEQFAQQTCVKTILITTKMGCYKELKKRLENSHVKVLPISSLSKVTIKNSMPLFS
ncbi:hypothetical protein HYV11_03090 [Candidatus Dependentiae bacterium]|nr:hypothetical protein [Candidatus Dependentiae bacterium]